MTITESRMQQRQTIDRVLLKTDVDFMLIVRMCQHMHSKFLKLELYRLYANACIFSMLFYMDIDFKLLPSNWLQYQKIFP